jgi:GT2 family glycosyltransferase
MPIYYFTPYALDKNLGAAYNHYMELLPGNDDWACFLDGDTMFLSPDWGHLIEKAISEFPDTGMFTCYTNRVNNKEQLYRGVFNNNRDIIAHRNIALVCHEIGKNRAKKLTRMVSGMMMIIQKKTWREFPFSDGLLGVDNDISQRLLNAGKEVRLIESIYLFHYYRLAEGRTYKNHLL